MADVPNTSGQPPVTPGAAPVTDRRPVPRGVLPRGTQTWLMAALALGMLLVIFVAGRPEPAPPAAAAASAPPPSPERVRDYQDRLRALDARAAQEAQAAVLAPPPPPPAAAYADTPPPPPQDPIVSERRRREYESLFASNVVLSRRPEDQRPDSGRAVSSTSAASTAPAAPADASIDDIADAALRATLRAGAAVSGSTAALPSSSPPANAVPSSGPANAARAMRTEAISAAGPMHQILAGTVIDAVLTNRLDGSVAAPVNCLVTNPVYSHSRQHVLIPAGARLLGETKPVQALGETRLAVAFNRLLMPDGSTQSLDSFLGLNQIGDAGLRDQVDHHYRSTFGAAGAVGLISGLAQFLGTAGLGRGDGDRTVIIAGGATDATAQASLQVMNRFLNRMPTITIREGHRVKVYLTSDLELPAYTGPTVLGK
jgi:type IV secretory pathway VirB10-like protein